MAMLAELGAAAQAFMPAKAARDLAMCMDATVRAGAVVDQSHYCFIQCFRAEALV